MSVDYLPKYMTDEGFDFPRLLFNHRHYVSAAKLLMTFIDKIGDSPRVTDVVTPNLPPQGR
jgi:hypothetical protein